MDVSNATDDAFMTYCRTDSRNCRRALMQDARAGARAASRLGSGCPRHIPAPKAQKLVNDATSALRETGKSLEPPQAQPAVSAGSGGAARCRAPACSAGSNSSDAQTSRRPGAVSSAMKLAAASRLALVAMMPAA